MKHSFWIALPFLIILLLIGCANNPDYKIIITSGEGLIEDCPDQAKAGEVITLHTITITDADLYVSVNDDEELGSFTEEEMHMKQSDFSLLSHRQRDPGADAFGNNPVSLFESFQLQHHPNNLYLHKDMQAAIAQDQVYPQELLFRRPPVFPPPGQSLYISSYKVYHKSPSISITFCFCINLKK